MKILIIGATGFIGRAALAHLQGKGHEITAWVRDARKAKDLLGQGIKLVGPTDNRDWLKDELELVDSVINLAGRPIVGVRWNSKNKKDFYRSRIGTTEYISEQISRCTNPPTSFISASAVGFYGNRGNELLDEESFKGEGYLADLCSDWEKNAASSEKYGVRVCILRLGIVVGREGGFLKQIMSVFDLRIGAYTGDGSQKIPWVHLSDTVRAIDFCLVNEEMRGPINISSPFPVTSKQFCETLSNVCKTWFELPLPTLLLKILYGEGAEVLTSGQNALPTKLMDAGFTFTHESLYAAIKNEVRPQSVTIERIIATDSRSEGSEIGQYRLKAKVTINTNSREVFDFFSSPLNLGLSTPRWLGFQITDMPEKIVKGSEISYRINLGLLPLTWRSVILQWNPDQYFVDQQVKGPYKLWRHEHRIIANSPDTSVMEDSVIYIVPGWIFGRLIHFLFIRRFLIRIFAYRRSVIQLMFR